MEAGPAPGEEAGHAAVRRDGADQLHLSHEADLHTLRFHALRGGGRVAGQTLQQPLNLVEGTHGDGHMVEFQRRR